jgi:hypothetical protein
MRTLGLKMPMKVQTLEEEQLEVNLKGRHHHPTQEMGKPMPRVTIL